MSWDSPVGIATDLLAVVLFPANKIFLFSVPFRSPLEPAQPVAGVLSQKVKQQEREADKLLRSRMLEICPLPNASP
jgi:hypothetical protein